MKKKNILILTFLLLTGIILTACNNIKENNADINNIGDINNNFNNIEDDNMNSDNVATDSIQITEENANLVNSDNTLDIDDTTLNTDAKIEGSNNTIAQEESVTKNINNETNDTIYYYVLGNGVRLRELDSLNSEIILQLNHGNQVEYLDEKGDWIKVRYGSETGYIKKDLLSEILQEEESLDENMSIDNPKIIVKKKERILQLWDGESLYGSYPIGLGWEPEGHKQKEGDGRTPEGKYYVCTRNNYSRFYFSLGVSYPNKEDGREALESELINQSTYDQIANAIDGNEQPPWNTALGGEIMIHGHGSDSDWTAGCVAVDNDIMDILWDSCPIGTPIIIEP